MEELIICPNDVKKQILMKESNQNEIKNQKFMTPHEFFSEYFFSYDYQTISYIMKKYNCPVSIAKEYLSNLTFIEDIDYHNKKLIFLRDLKKELKEKELLFISQPFQVSLPSKKLSFKHVFDLNQYQEKVLGKVEVPEVTLNFPVYRFDTLEEEAHFVCVEIRKLLQKGIPLSKIFLCNVSEDYYFVMDKLFSYYGIPIEISYQNSIYSTTIVQNYLKTGELDLESKDPITKSICRILGDLVELEDDSTKQEILIDCLKNTFLPNTHYEEAITIHDLKDRPFEEDEYVFVLGFNQDSLPSIQKDISYLSDSDKEEVELYSTKYINNREKKVIAYLLSQIKNLTISYKNSSFSSKFYPSSMIDEYKLEVKDVEVNDTEYSDLYNQIRLGDALDTYYLYGEKNKVLEELSLYYNHEYGDYDSSFTGINEDTFLKNLSYPLRLSYTALNSYRECGFKYYINNVLKLGSYEQTFAALVGSLYHEILSLYKNPGFDLDIAWNKYLEEKDLSLKDTVLLVRIRKDLEELLSVLKKQQTYTTFNQEYYEKLLKVKVRDDILVEFIGYVDKIMTLQNISDTYFSIVDYKTGTIDTHIEPMKYGLHMQLPIYLYLIQKSNVFDSPIFTGIYYQNILFHYPTWSKDLEKDKKDQYQLKGYSTDNTELLEKFDCTYKDSEYIKSMKYNDKFDRYSKVLSDEDVYKITKYTDKIIQETTDDILHAKFPINPKVYNKENVSCKYCEFHDMCYMSDQDVTYLDKVEDFSFLGGEE